MKLKPPSVTPRVGDVAMRYPGGDPEDGPAYPQRFTASGWECMEHKFRRGLCIYCSETDGELPEFETGGEQDD